VNVQSAGIDLNNALEAARLVWDETRAGWDDAVRRDFEANQWDQLERQVQAVLQAIDRVAPLLARAVRDCS